MKIVYFEQQNESMHTSQSENYFVSLSKGLGNNDREHHEQQIASLNITLSHQALVVVCVSCLQSC